MSCTCECCNSNATPYQKLVATSIESIREIEEKTSEIDQVVNVAKKELNEHAEQLNARLEETFKSYIVPTVDNEDISMKSDNALILADRECNPMEYIEKGYKILRRKEETVECDCCGEVCTRTVLSNKLTNDDFVDTNTIYVVRYTFDLNGATISIPANCEIKFEGGSLNNGTIVLNQCKITGMMGDINGYFKNVNLSGYANGQLRYDGSNLQIYIESAWKNIA